MTTPRRGRLFGTDGIRGAANQGPMTVETVARVAMAAGQLSVPGARGHRPVAVIGKDTRLSGYMLEPAMVAGFTAIGMDVVLVGPLPTPAVAMLTRSLRADLGVMLSASHNPYHDNGIKLFGPDGHKLSDETEAAIEAMVAADGAVRAPPGQLGRARRLDDGGGRYIEAVKASFPPGLRLDGIRLAVDCAHGAGYRVAPTVLHELGAEIVPIGVAPDGFNINQDSGAVAPERLRQTVLESGADLGIALDGDADRLIMVDETGRILDGDQIMGLIAAAWQGDGRLRGGGVVATVMSNLGLERFLAGHGLTLTRTDVGDRHVIARMRAAGCNLGGEQSGHVIFGDYATTGDGLMAALQVLAVLVRGNRPFGAAAQVFTPLPQLLRNVPTNGHAAPLQAEPVRRAVRAAETRLARRGRLLIRESGTEPLIRVMAEGEDEDEIAAIVEEVAGAIERAGGAPP